MLFLLHFALILSVAKPSRMWYYIDTAREQPKQPGERLRRSAPHLNETGAGIFYAKIDIVYKKFILPGDMVLKNSRKNGTMKTDDKLSSLSRQVNTNETEQDRQT